MSVLVKMCECIANVSSQLSGVNGLLRLIQINHKTVFDHDIVILNLLHSADRYWKRLYCRHHYVIRPKLPPIVFLGSYAAAEAVTIGLNL